MNEGLQRLLKGWASFGYVGRWTASTRHRTLKRTARSHLARILDLLVEDSWRRVYAGQLEVRPPGAPTTRTVLGGSMSLAFVG